MKKSGTVSNQDKSLFKKRLEKDAAKNQGGDGPGVTMVVCRSATTSTQPLDNHTSMTTKSRSKKLRIFSAGHCKIYADGMILEFQSVRLGRGGI